MKARVWLGVLLLVIGLVWHLLAAHVEGGRPLYYQHHIFGWLLLTVITGIVIAVLGRFFWRGRHDITLLIVGALQSVVGFLIYLSFSNRV